MNEAIQIASPKARQSGKSNLPATFGGGVTKYHGRKPMSSLFCNCPI